MGFNALLFFDISAEQWDVGRFPILYYPDKDQRIRFAHVRSIADDLQQGETI